MAPHALTPTIERDNIFNSTRIATAPSAGSDDVGETLPSHAAREREDTSISSPEAHANIDDLSTNPLYESAYVKGYEDGYTSGYTKSHIALKHQPIAIIGMSCRFPGNVSTPEEFWELLARCRTGFSTIPSSRFAEERFFHPNPGKSGTTNARGGNFLSHNLKAFDAPFFGFTQQEAVSLDPQQRLLLECTFEVLEGAGIPMQNVVGKDVGVFVGGTFSEYEADLFRDSETIPMHQATGCAMAMQSNRISHFFDFRGPSFTVDTACSSSLVAIHTACQSLRNGESSMAVAAGVHLNMLPEFWISYSMSRLFGEPGRSFAFDQRGTGYGRGEGCGMILLKPLDQALKDNDPIRAVITGSGINQDGKTPGITMPNGLAQEELIRSVYKNGNMDPKDTGYVEAHGTGTRVGDPIEVSALQKVFGEGRTKRKPLYVGSVKSNIGHLEAAAGIAGVLKTALMLERGFVLPNYDFQKANAHIPFDEWGLKVPIRQQPWPYGKRWASVNGFGFGGTNAHIVMTRGPLERKTMKEEIDTQVSERLFVLSANDKSSSETAMQNLGVYLERRPEVFENDLLGNLAYTLGERRSLHPWRIAISASTSVELVQNLFSGKIIPIRQELEELRIGWIFTGQGAQWWAMGRELYHQYPVYALALERADNHLRSLDANFSVIEELHKDENNSQINTAHISQPACTSVQLALVELLRSWNVRPSAVAGHSSGEIGAAYAADLITFEDAMTIAYHRGRLIPELKARFPLLEGSMMAVAAGQSVITPIIDLIPSSLGQVRMACINSPSSVTVSGDTEAVACLELLIEEQHPGTFTRKLQVDTAYHSHHMNHIAKEYTKSLAYIRAPKESAVRFHSSLLGRLAHSDELDASYWVQNLVCAVRFDEAMQSMCQKVGDSQTGVNFLIELGPHGALQGPIKQILKHIGSSASSIAYSSVLSRNKKAVTTALDLAGKLFVKGMQLNMGAINSPKPLDRPPQVLTDLPRYSWNHSSTFHHESRFMKVHKFHNVIRNDLIGILAPYSNDFEPEWRNILRLDDLPWLRHHEIQGVIMFPISGFIVMAIEAFAQRAQTEDVQYDQFVVEGLNVQCAVMLTEEDLEMTTTLRPSPESSNHHFSHHFNIRSWSKTKGWTEHCTGLVSAISLAVNEVDGARAHLMSEQRLLAKRTAISNAATTAVSLKDMYEGLSKIGVTYGSTFQGLRDCHASQRAAVARLVPAATMPEMPHGWETRYILHPTLLEQLISMYWPVAAADAPLRTAFLPSSLAKVTISKTVGSQLKDTDSCIEAYCEPSAPASDFVSSGMSMYAVDAQGRHMISVEGLGLVAVPGIDSDTQMESPRELCYKLDWEVTSQPPVIETIHSTPHPDSSEVVIIFDDVECQRKLADAISGRITALTGLQPVLSTLLSVGEGARDKLCIFLTELHRPVLANLGVDEFQALQVLLKGVEGILWVTRRGYKDSNNPNSNMISGFSRTLRSEGTVMRFITLDLDMEGSTTDAAGMHSITEVFNMTLRENRDIQETEFVERKGKLLTPRIVHNTTLNQFVHEQLHPAKILPARFVDQKRPLQAVFSSPSESHSVSFDDMQTPSKDVPEDAVAIYVKAVGISSRDIATHSSAIGIECSGVVINIGSKVTSTKIGDHVAAITPQGSLSTVTYAKSCFVMKLPDHVSFEAAATIPMAFGAAAYALMDQVRLGDSETVLVHDAASAVGQAAVRIAQMIGANVWTTVRTAREKDMLMQEFFLAEDRIWFIDAAALIESIKDVTGGRGIDVVINTHEGCFDIQKLSDCIAHFGRLVNIETDCHVPGTLSYDKTLSISTVNMAALAKHQPRILQLVLANVSRLLQYGKVQAIQCTKTFGITELTTALDHIRQFKGEMTVVVVPREDEMVLAPRVHLDYKILPEDATYVLIGGTGGLGRSIARWLARNGAKHIVLLSRSGIAKGKAMDEINALNQDGTQVVIRRCDVADRSDVDKLVSMGLRDLPPVRGIIHGAMVLHDVLFEKMAHDQYSSVVEAKVQGAWNVHHAFEGVALDFFILISSAAGAVGNRGQAAYAAANTFLNGFAQYLVGRGVSATSIDLTAVSDAGYLAEDKKKAAEVARNLGSDTICEAEVLALIQAAIQGELASCNGHAITGMRITSSMQPFWSHDAKFLHLLKAAEADSASSPTSAAKSWSALFKAATCRPEAAQVVCEALVQKIAEVIAMEPEALDIGRALSHYPLDSLTAIEVRNFIARMFEANMQVLELLASGTISSLAQVVCGKSKALGHLV
ncbi:hypothetical protein IAQ61_006471 [Plenodomus lingam]|uniref:Polyketide synthase 3 n=1 Tax=Leptosphaeria maculans TaxID=5022 RepID=L7WCE4_LEPMC|nr:polyketide synthase 3 [Plenodomus lingam]KAH9869266.1 hypothetical protein IAQ61_006471 [Plenodomus lingam]